MMSQILRASSIQLPPRYIRFFVLLLLVVVKPFLVFAQPGESIKVASWNLHWFPGHSSTASPKEVNRHMAEAKAVLRKINPDVFVGIEMHDWEAFRELCSVVPGLTPYVVTNFCDPQTGSVRPQQIGIAAKLKCRAAGWEPWKVNVPNIPRGFAYVALEDPSTHKLILVYGNHLKSNKEGDTPEGEQMIAEMRNEQASQLVQNLEKSKVIFGAEKIRGWILAGDFNTNHDNEFPKCHVIEKLVDAGFLNTWIKTPKEKRATWQGDFQGGHSPTTFDYILTRGFGDNLQASMIEIARSTSDHCPVILSIP